MASGVVGGVDTHADVHVAAALDTNGGLFGIESFPTDAAGYWSLADWLAGFGPVVSVGVEGTESYRVGLTRHVHNEGVAAVEVDRPVVNVCSTAAIGILLREAFASGTVTLHALRAWRNWETRQV